MFSVLCKPHSNHKANTYNRFTNNTGWEQKDSIMENKKSDSDQNNMVPA